MIAATPISRFRGSRYIGARYAILIGGIFNSIKPFTCLHTYDRSLNCFANLAYHVFFEFRVSPSLLCGFRSAFSFCRIFPCFTHCSRCFFPILLILPNLF